MASPACAPLIRFWRPPPLRNYQTPIPHFASILEGALCVLRAPDPYAKAAIAESLSARCRDLPLRPPPPGGADADADADADAAALAPPAKPARPAFLTTVCGGQAPKRGRGGTAASRAAMLHALVHIESWACDLAADCIARFAAAPNSHYPRSLATDFVAVLADEARHFSLLDARLRQIHPEGKGYGCLPVHEGLWESAERTARSLPARLAVESCLHEARGLDVLPQTISRFRAGGDEGTADLLENVVYGEEIAHCAAGIRWLTYAHARARGLGGREAMARASAAAGPPVAFSEEKEDGGGPAPVAEEEQEDDDDDFPAPGGHEEEDWREDARRHATPALWFRSLVARNFYGSLRPPFNEEARGRAGFTPEWYAEDDVGDAGERRRGQEEDAGEEAGAEAGAAGEGRAAMKEAAAGTSGREREAEADGSGGTRGRGQTCGGE
jgi:uncharacterized ferritin-like protein (DUF455 family)